MEQAIPLLAFVAFLVTVTWLRPKHSNRRHQRHSLTLKDQDD